jgi:aryl carrier-like protein
VASTEAVGEAALEWSVREIDDANALDREGLDAVAMLEDVAYAFERRAGQISETGLAERIIDRWEHVAASLRHAASYAEDQIGFNLVTQRR